MILLSVTIRRFKNILTLKEQWRHLGGGGRRPPKKWGKNKIMIIQINFTYD